MAEQKTIRTRAFETIVSLISNFAIAQGVLNFDNRNVVSEASRIPQTADLITVRILDALTRTDHKPHRYVTDEANDIWTMMTHGEVSVQLQCFGAKAWAVLDAWMHAQQDLDQIKLASAHGFSIVGTQNGIVDQSDISGAFEQLRGVAQITLGCKILRDRVTNQIEEFAVDGTVSDVDQPDLVISVTVQN